MAQLKTQPTDSSVDDFIAQVADPERRDDCRTVLALMARITGEQPLMWGAGMVGFGSYHYKYASGREGDMFLAGFSPRKQYLTLYIMAGFSRYDTLMARLGQHKVGKSCLYIKRLSDIDATVLEELIVESVKHMRKVHGT